MDLKQASKALMAMYGASDNDADERGGPSDGDGDTAHDAAFMARDNEPGGLGIKDMPGFEHAEKRPKGPFVDRINDDGMAVLLMPDGSTSEIPASRLPRGTHEGAYLGPDGVDDLLGQTAEIDGLRKKLSAGDDGRELKL